MPSTPPTPRFYIIIAVQAAVITDFTCNAALIFSGHIQIIVCITVKISQPSSGDTTDIIFTGDPAHAIAAADRIAGRSGNTTHITASGTFNGGIGFTGDNCSVFRLADDTSHVIFFTSDITEIATVSYDCLDGLLHIEALRSGQGDVILRVKIIFRCHLSDDTADIGIRLYRTTIYTQCDFTFWKLEVSYNASSVLSGSASPASASGSPGFTSPCWRIHPKYPPQKSPRIGRDHRGSR